MKFWNRAFFLGVDRHIWRVTGAHDFTPLATTHYTNGFERWTYTGENVERLRSTRCLRCRSSSPPELTACPLTCTQLHFRSGSIPGKSVNYALARNEPNKAISDDDPH